MPMNVKRLQKELSEVERDKKISGVSITLCEDGDLSHLRGTIKGPVGTPYEGGLFQIDIRLPQQYPFRPPKMQFITKVWHPNISSETGAICVDILKDKWSVALKLKTTLLSLQALLSAPEPTDPQDAMVAQQYLKDNKAFVNTARYWTETYAKGDYLEMEDKVRRLTDMGFPQDAVRSTLEKCGGHENMALHNLCDG